MSDFDPTKEAINLAKHRISLSRWVDLKISATVPDSRFVYGEPRYRAYGCWMACRIAWFLRCVTMRAARSVYDVLMPRS
jgi:uncharacterized DUF497 family protein